MTRKSWMLATLAAAVMLGTVSTKANADPVAGALIGGGIGAAVGGPVGAAVGAVLGSAIGSEPYYYHRRHGDRYDRHGRYEDRRYYDRGYDRGYAPPVRYYEPAPAPRAYREARYEPAPRYYDAPRYERYDQRYDRYYDDRREYRDDPYYGRRY